ncbi:MAG TPA: prolyl oligopeptidase family serine peptidase [Candidatus Eremiobacteraceae bacterium]
MNSIHRSVAVALLVCVFSISQIDVPRASAQPSDAPQTTVAKALPNATDDTDPFLWLEQVHGERATAWVKAENAKTTSVLERDPHYPSFYAEAQKIAESNDRIPFPNSICGEIYNFWRDHTHVRGIWRRTSAQSYATAKPAWTTVLDLDALAKSEHANWVWEGSDCELPDEHRCLISLSDGGEDAQTIREFDVTTRRFVSNGFVLTRGKQNVTWENPDTLLVAREWKAGDLTASGYPFIVKRLSRGQPLESATEVYRGTKTDVGVGPFVLHDGSGHQVTMIERNVTFFTAEHYLATTDGVRKLDLPAKINISGLVAGRLLLTLNESWTVGGTVFPEGSLVAIDLAAMEADPAHLHPTLVYTPGERESLDAIVPTKDRLLVVSYLDVKGRALVFTPAASGSWTKQVLDLPDNSSIGLDDSNLRNDTAYVDATNFLSPTTLYSVDAATGIVSPVKAQPAQFDASNDVVEQQEATSKDGTKIPYFIVHPKSMVYNGSNPTVLYAYGGFQVSETPFYSANIGKLWLERGGVFVLANIRGGGEFGPAWHDAGLKTHRQLIYDDFYAVAADLVSRKVTTPRHLGIQGGSNGGLLMGVEFTQHPDMWNAVDMQVPLLDMLRFEKIEAGASWVGEYGSVSVPEERAFLASISPYQNVKPGVAYPEPLVWTTTKDDRVGPEHARKFAAKLAAMDVSYLFYEVSEGGHGSGANLDERAHTTALEWTYFTQKLMNGP